MSGCYIYCRDWTGFTDEFPFFDDLNHLPDDALAIELCARAADWLRHHKSMVKAHLRAQRKRATEAREQVLRAITERPRSSNISIQTNRESRVKSLRHAGRQEIPRLRRTALWQRVGSIAGWYDGTSLAGIPSPSPILYLGSLSDPAVARQLATSMADYRKDPDCEAVRLRFGVRSVDELGIARTARIELEIEDLAKRRDPLSKFHLSLVNDFRRLLAKLAIVESRIAPDPTARVRPDAVTPAAPPEAQTDSGPNASLSSETGGGPIKRLRLAKDEFIRLIRELQDRLADAGGDPIKARLWTCQMRLGELAATLGLPKAPVAYRVIQRPGTHSLLISHPEYVRIETLEVRDPHGPVLVSIALAALRLATDVHEAAEPEVLPAPTETQRQAVFGTLKSWERKAEHLDLHSVRYTVANRPTHFQSYADFAFFGMLSRELRGLGDPTEEEEQRHEAEHRELVKLGALEQIQRSFDERAKQFVVAATIQTQGSSEAPAARRDEDVTKKPSPADSVPIAPPADIPPDAVPGRAQPAHLRAAASYEWVCGVRPELAPTASRQKYSRRQWEHVKENDCPAYRDETTGSQLDVPDFETWKRQVRAGQADREAPKASFRHGRVHGKTIVRSDEL